MTFTALVVDGHIGNVYLNITNVSGGKYQYVPAPCEVSSILVPSLCSSKILLRPKSVIFAVPDLSNKIFPGFRS